MVDKLGELEKALFKEGLIEQAKRGLSTLTGEERVRILRHIGTQPFPDDQYGRLPSVIEHLSPTWNHEGLSLSDMNFKFPIINQQALFVRKCYHELYDMITKLPTTVIQSIRILLTGTPGIGKSTFLVYFIIRHLYESGKVTLDRRMLDIIILQPAGSENEIYAFAAPNIVRKGTYSDFEAFFLIPTTLYLVDWKPKSKPISKPATTLFTLSPNSIQDDDFKDFEKVLFMRLCMPVWSYDELEACRRHVFPEQSTRSLSYIYSRAGGVPRSCLEAPTEALRVGCSEEMANEKGLQRLEDAFNQIKDPLDFLRTQEQSLGLKVSGRLLHKVPGVPDSETSYRDSSHRIWASAYVIDRFIGMVDTHAADNMNRQVMEGLARNERDGTLGKIFECYVRHLFFKGGGVKLRKRRLYGVSNKRKQPAQQWFTMPKNLEHKPFSGMIDFSIPEEDTGTIWTPGPNFPSVDLILTPNFLFQITISSYHPVKQEPLRKIVEKLPAKENISLYFVVPEEKFETFTLQNYQNEQGKLSRKVPKSIEMLEQWVLGVPLGGVLRKKKADQSEVQGMKKRAAEDDMPAQLAKDRRRRTE